jgi:2-polyprenyl-3-methyl-5-hydroxy-6-metoxy-1,4-benzoquinol methylase
VINNYNEDYFERGIETSTSLYTNYRWIPELTIPMCSDLVYQLDIPYGTTILDYGCAKGYSVKALRLLHRKSYGVDISKYAIENCATDMKEYVRLIKENEEIPMLHGGAKYDWCFAKDVLEHVPYEDLSNCLENIRKVCEKLFVAVPLGDGKNYFCKAFELDKTHIIREPLDWWEAKLSKAGFKVEEAKHRMKYIKENYAQFEKANGFFICT